MFRKIVFGIFFSIVPTLEAAPVQAKEGMRLTPAFGILWDADSFHDDLLWTLGLSADFFLIKNVALTPEFYMAGKKVGFKDYLLQPGLMLNFHHPRFFVGGGVVKEFRARNQWPYEGIEYPPITVWNVVWTHVWKFKINAGFSVSKIRFTVFFLTRFDDMGWFPRSASQRGATIGYSF
jgi:hypothetical protein